MFISSLILCKYIKLLKSMCGHHIVFFDIAQTQSQVVSKKFSVTRIVNTRSNASQMEITLENLLRQKFANAKDIHVEDISGMLKYSGGCGEMYEIWVETRDFKNLSIVKQHKLITDTLKEEIKGMHGLRINTAVAED